MTETTARSVDLIDPRTLLVDVNVRRSTTADKDFVASLKQFGVLQPIVGVRTATGEVRVRFGHRRTIGAIEAGLATVPVLVAGDEGTDKDAGIERLLTQYAENEHREGLTRIEAVDVVEQLSLLDVPAATIAKRTRLSRADVDAAITIAKSQKGKRLQAEYELTLDQAAALVEFEDDPDVFKRLVTDVKRNPAAFAHYVGYARERRADAKEAAEFAVKIRESGVAVIERPGWSDVPAPLTRLLTSDGEEITSEQHAECPGHVVWSEYEWVYVKPDGTVVDDESDEASELEDEDEPSGVEYVRRLAAVYGCSDPAAYGHADTRRTHGGHRGNAATPAADAMTEDERLAAEAAAAESKRQERRAVIANNKAWDRAEPIRRAWVKDNLAGRRTLPKNSGAFMVDTIRQESFILQNARLAVPALGWLPKDEADWLKGASEARAQVVQLMLMLAAYEDTTDRDHWRNPARSTERYLLWLQEQGYALSDVERMAAKLPALPNETSAD